MIQLFSIHIPKTGGRSFDAMLKKVYGEKEVFNMTRAILRDQSQKLEDVLPEKFTVLHGHLWFKDIAPLYEKNPAPLITWLRDPVERVISNYYFMIERIRAGARPKQIHRQNETLIDHIRHEDDQNVMARYLEGRSLKDFLFVGILERVKQDLKDLSRLLKWPKTESVVLNSNREFRAQFGPVSREIREDIRKYNQEDVALYEEALELRRARRRKQRFRISRVLEWVSK